MWQWLVNNWHKIGLVLLAISHFWEKFEKIYNSISGFVSRKSNTTEKIDRAKLLEELIDAAQDKGYNEAIYHSMSNSSYVNRQSVKKDGIKFKKLLAQVKKEFDI